MIQDTQSGQPIDKIAERKKVDNTK